ncbi:MAG TPA: hypothetical protein VFK58_04965 [Sphingomicrobium sp.]|nr:hypothetical protein [Sphingomicrobium sp.]
MLRFSAFLALVALAAPAASEPRRVVGERDGIAYDYTADLDRDGNLLLRGVYLNTTERFRFKVAPNGRVTGYVDNRRVNYSIGREARDRAVAGRSSTNAAGAARTAAR